MPTFTKHIKSIFLLISITCSSSFAEQLTPFQTEFEKAIAPLTALSQEFRLLKGQVSKNLKWNLGNILLFSVAGGQEDIRLKTRKLSEKYLEAAQNVFKVLRAEYERQLSVSTSVGRLSFLNETERELHKVQLQEKYNRFTFYLIGDVSNILAVEEHKGWIFTGVKTFQSFFSLVQNAEDFAELFFIRPSEDHNRFSDTRHLEKFRDFVEKYTLQHYSEGNTLDSYRVRQGGGYSGIRITQTAWNNSFENKLHMYHEPFQNASELYVPLQDGLKRAQTYWDYRLYLLLFSEDKNGGYASDRLYPPNNVDKVIPALSLQHTYTHSVNFHKGHSYDPRWYYGKIDHISQLEIVREITRNFSSYYTAFGFGIDMANIPNFVQALLLHPSPYTTSFKTVSNGYPLAVLIQWKEQVREAQISRQGPHLQKLRSISLPRIMSVQNANLLAKFNEEFQLSFEAPSTYFKHEEFQNCVIYSKM